MTRDEWWEQFNIHIDNMKSTAIGRNRNYATEEDALTNLKKIGLLGIITHIEDKVSRLQTAFTNKEVTRDSCIDIANYALLYNILYDTLYKD